jgi:hypothetical protein
VRDYENGRNVQAHQETEEVYLKKEMTEDRESDSERLREREKCASTSRNRRSIPQERNDRR